MQAIMHAFGSTFFNKMEQCDVAKKRCIITSDDILGKDVVDTDGEILGVVQQLKIDKEQKNILGVVVDQGFMKPDLFIGLDFIKNFGIDSVFLNQSPWPKIKGLDVYDSNGKKAGFVFDVENRKKTMFLSSIIIKKNRLGKSYRVNIKDVKTIGFNVILKKSAEETHLEEIEGSGIRRGFLKSD